LSICSLYVWGEGERSCIYFVIFGIESLWGYRLMREGG
jgi:hypothetical protein